MGQATELADAASDAPTPHRKHLDYLDGWRGIAVLLVLVGHFFPISFIHVGRVGVELFFALSGRLMSGILFVELYPLTTFFKRRITRVWPALWIFVLASAVWFSGPGELHIGVNDIAGALTFTANYVSAAAGISDVFEHLWSLAVEEWAYVLLAALAAVQRRFNVRPARAMIILAVLCAMDGIWRTHLGGSNHEVYWLTEVRLSSILIPAALFLLLRNWQAPSWIPVASGLAGILFSTHAFPDPVKYTIGTSCFAMAITTIDRAAALVTQLLSTPPLRMVGLISFSLYLWQQPLYALIRPAQAQFGLVAKPMLLATAFSLAAASYWLVEQPTRKWLNRTWAGRSNQRASEPPAGARLEQSPG